MYSACQTVKDANLNFISKSGELVNAHQALILPRSSYLKLLVEASGSCGCVQDVPTLLLPDWDLKTIQAMIRLLEFSSVVLTNNSMEEVLRMMKQLGFDISQCQFSFVQEICTQELLQKITIKKAKTEKRNEEQESVRKKLNEVVDFLGRVQIKNEESLDTMKKPVDKLVSSLKYLPIEPSFDFLPTEIKTNILSYLCNSGAFVSASVCHEWKKILEKKLVNQEITIYRDIFQNRCSNRSCEMVKCFMPVEIVKASAAVKLGVCLKIRSPVLISIDSKLLAEGLTSVPKLRITKKFRFGEKEGNILPVEMLTQDQMEQFIETLEKKNGVLKSLELNGLNMANVDQAKLMNCLLKVERLFLGYGLNYNEPLLNGDVLIDQLLHNASNSRISELYLEDIKHSNLSPEDLANALCHVESVYLGRRALHSDYWHNDCKMTKRILYNVLNSPIRMENLFVFQEFAWSDLMDPESLKVVMTKLKKFAFYGDLNIDFEDYVEVARNIPGVNIVSVVNNRETAEDPFDDRKLIEKGIGIDTSSITTFDLSELFFYK